MFGNSFANSISQPEIITPPAGILQRSVAGGITMAMPPLR